MQYYYKFRGLGAMHGGSVRSEKRSFGLFFAGTLAAALSSPIPSAFAGTVTVTPLNHISDYTESGVRTIVFRATGSGDCANQITYPLGSNSTINPTDTVTGLRFQVKASSTLATINGGAVSDGDVSVRVELSSATTTGIALVNTGYPTGATDAYWINYGTVDSSTEEVGISMASNPGGITGVGFCAQAGIDCQPGPGASVTPLTVKFTVLPTGQESGVATAEDISESIRIIMAECPAGSAVGPSFVAPTLNFGIINGDQRVKISNSTSPPTSLLGVPLSRVVVYADPTSNAGGVTTNASIKREFGDVDGGVYDVEGLANDTQYCFSLGYVNAAGLVTTSTSSSWTSTLSTGQCATPSKVDGFLDRSTCFIASAAYGDEWDPRLETLRQFRDQLLSQTQTGRSFIDWYYSWSPQAAQWLFHHPGYRIAVRMMLLPLVESARAALWLKQNMWAFGVALLTGTFGVLVVRLRSWDANAE